MTIEETEFIIETLQEAIEWGEYADDYFKMKHDLKQDQENVDKSISILKDALQAKSKSCDNCKLYMDGWCDIAKIDITALEMSVEWLCCSKHEPK